MNQVIEFHRAAQTTQSFDLANAHVRPITTAPEIDMALLKGAVIAIGVSGGKDSDACALATMAYLNVIGHTGPRVIIHADLGVVEWKDSLPCCERLAEKLGLELIVCRRAAGDMMDRWEGRWKNNTVRYRDLSCVKVILPWSTPSMRFCTSELKAQVISSALRKRFPVETIINVTGIRRQESAARAKASVWGVDKKLSRKNAVGLVWNPIIDWLIEQVFANIALAGLALHEAYTVYGASRVSCAFCIMSAAKDLLAAASCADNHDLYRRMVSLEIRSTYAFQGGKWLGDAAPHLLPADMLAGLAAAKARASTREAIEKEIPSHLLFVKGSPVQMPTAEEAALIASVRLRIGHLLDLDVQCVTAESVMDRYAALLALQAVKAAKALKDDKKAAAAMTDEDELEEEFV